MKRYNGSLFGRKKGNMGVVLIVVLVIIVFAAMAFYVGMELSRRDAAAKQDGPMGGTNAYMLDKLADVSNPPSGNSAETSGATEIKSQTTQPELYTFGSIASDAMTTDEQVKTRLIESCATKPEVLAATISAFPTLIETAGVSLDANFTICDLDDLLGNDDQARMRLFTALEEALGRADTQYEFVTASDGWVDLLYLAKYDHDAEMSPETMSLVLVPAYVGRCEFVKVTITTNGTAETAALFIPGGLQRALLDYNPDAPYRISTGA